MALRSDHNRLRLLRQTRPRRHQEPGEIMSKPKPKAEKVILYPPLPKLAVDAMEDEFAAFIADPKRKARRLKDNDYPRPT